MPETLSRTAEIGGNPSGGPGSGPEEYPDLFAADTRSA
jgi:hypothetical protein